jgi:replicative superfamily II helicase
MSGRAGRTGFDAKGDSIMVCSKEYIPHVLELIKPFECKLVSALTGSRLMRSLLVIIASGSITTMVDVGEYLKNTLKYVLCVKSECS